MTDKAMKRADPREIAKGKATATDGGINAFIYDQEGNLQPFRVKDTAGNRHFIEWLQCHDRYTPASPRNFGERA